MKILLLNENPVVSKLINLSAQKMAYEIDELVDVPEELTHYDIIIVDSDIQADLGILAKKCDRLIFLAPRNKECSVKAQILQKPFLPTDFLSLLNEEPVKFEDELVNGAIVEENVFGGENPYANISLDLDSLNLEDLPDSHEEEVEETLDSLSMDEDEQNKLKQELENGEEMPKDSDLSLDSLSLEDSSEADENTLASEELSLEEGEIKEASDGDLNLAENLEDTESEKNTENLEITENLEQEDLSTDEPNLDEVSLDELNLDNEKQEALDKLDNISLDEPNLDNETLEPSVAESVDNESFDSEGLELDLENESLENESLENEENLSENEEALAENEELDTQSPALSEIDEGTELEVANSDLGDELAPVVEEQEGQVEFDDLPSEASFLGSKDEGEYGELDNEFEPIVDENTSDQMSNLSTQDQIKEELAALDELEEGIDSDDGAKILEEFKDEPILDEEELEEELGLDNEKLVVPDIHELSDEFNNLSENDIKSALGEELSEESTNEPSVKTPNTLQSEEIVNELSQSIAGAIENSIKDDALKAALKGMNMNINIKISFEDNK